MARLDSYLAVTARAWDRLPPLASNRSGSSARLELWVKRQIKRATHWFTWEQINFNAAVHHALRDSLQALSGLERALERLRVETDTQRTALEQSQETLKVELQTQRDEFQTQRDESQIQRNEFKARIAEIETQRAAQDLAQRKEINARLAAFAQEMQDRFGQLQEEQRVCFKQLSLEAGETAVMEDRLRRKSASLLEELSRRVEQLEKQ